MLNKFTLIIVVITLISKRDANVDCITVRSSKSSTSDDAKSLAICPSSHRTLVSCGASTANADAFSFDGSYIDTNAIPARCYAQNAIRGAGVYAYARCCNFIPTDIDCIYSMSSTYSSSADDAVKTNQCGTNSHNSLLGCSVYTPWAKLDGAYPGYSTVQPDTITKFDTHNYPSHKQCSAVNAVRGKGVKASLACCHSPTYDLQCITRYGSPSEQISIVTCPNGYFLSGCSGWSKYGVNGWYIDDNKCFARSRNLVYSIAICCRLETENPTIDPTVSPTPSPTQFPSLSPTFQPTIFPTAMPTLPPSMDPTTQPTEVPSATPSVNPSQYPTNNPTLIPTNMPTQFPTDFPVMNAVDGEVQVTESPSTTSLGPDPLVVGKNTNETLMGGLVGGVVFLSLCVCCLGIIFGFYFWKNRKILNDEVVNVHHDGSNEVDMSSIPIEGVSTDSIPTKRNKKMTDDGQGFMVAMDSKKNHNLLSDHSDTDDDDGIEEVFGNGNHKTPLMHLSESDDDNVLPRDDGNDYGAENIINDAMDDEDNIFK